MSARLLVLDAYDVGGRAALAAAGVTFGGELYRRILAGLDPTHEVELVMFEPGGFRPARPLGDYDGIVWSGSNMTVHQDTADVRDQLEFARAAFAAGVPSFGSCWAVHIAVTATGGRCARNPRGREFGVSRSIALTEEGRRHPMYAGRAPAFAALTCHEDQVVELGPHAQRLAGNDFSAVQAVAVRRGRGEFWAVQYHPEYGLEDLARIGRLRSPPLIAQGLFRGPEDAARYMSEVEALAVEPERTDLRFRLGVDRDVIDPELRTAELRSWLAVQVKPKLG